MVESDKKSFKKMFPNLAKELAGGESTVPIDSVRTNPEEAEKSIADRVHNYNPTVVDFIRRCNRDRSERDYSLLGEKGRSNEGTCSAA